MSDIFHTSYPAYSTRSIKISLFFLSVLSFYLQGRIKEFDDTVYE